MQIKKRNLPQYMVLNCLTLGVYGFIASKNIGDEINALCKGDGEEPKFGYVGAVLLRGISTALGLVTGLIFGLIGFSFSLPIPGIGDLEFDIFDIIPGMGGYKAAIVFLSMTLFGVIFTLVGSIISGIYLKYWWYKQAARLKLNANRYGITVKEGGTDNFLFHTAVEFLFVPITIILFALSFFIPALIIWLITLADSVSALVMASVLLLIFAIPMMLFGTELTAGSNFAMFFIFKNLNRYADASRNGAAPFDSMAYEYYPSVNNKYPNFIPGMINGSASVGVLDSELKLEPDDGESGTGVLPKMGSLVGVSGSCAGYRFDLDTGEEIIIGKDAKVSMVVIDPSFKEISRKHVGVSYDVFKDQYRVVDYSSNGTWANGSKLVPGQAFYLPRGTELKLANDKNIFRLG